MSFVKDVLSFMENAKYSRATMKHLEFDDPEDAVSEACIYGRNKLAQQSTCTACNVETSAAPYVFEFNPHTGTPYVSN